MRSGGTSAERAGRGWWTALAVLTAVAAVARVLVARQAVFADELSTAWIVLDHHLGDIVGVVHTDAEITPPLTFVLSKLSTLAFGTSPVALRLPAVVAGTLLVPVVALLGRRTVGRAGALVAAVLVAGAPFTLYYSAEARAYGVMLLLATTSTLAMLLALDTGRRRWWALHAICVCGAMYSHYTAAFVLAAQLAWLLATQPAARRPALVATAAAVVGFLPWTSGALADFRSPTSKILDALSPLTPSSVARALEHWTVGYPYSIVGLGEIPGLVALLAFALALVLGAAGALRGLQGAGVGALVRSRLGLLVLLAAATFVGELVVSAVGSNLFGTRNLAASWPALALVVGALVAASPGRARFVAYAGAGLAAALAALQVVPADAGRPRYGDAAAYIDAHAAPGDAVIDAVVFLSPGPLSGLDITLERPLLVARAGGPAERAHPFSVFDRVQTTGEAVAQVERLRPAGRVFLVETRVDRSAVATAERTQALDTGGLSPQRYRVVAQRRWPAALGDTSVTVYARR